MVAEQTEAEPECAANSGSTIHERGRKIGTDLKRGVKQFVHSGRTTWISRAAISGSLMLLVASGQTMAQLEAGIELVCSTPLGQAFNTIFGLVMLGAVMHSFIHIGIGGIKMRPGGGGMQGQSNGRSMIMSGAVSFGVFLFLLGYPAVLAYFGQELTGCVAF